MNFIQVAIVEIEKDPVIFLLLLGIGIGDRHAHVLQRVASVAAVPAEKLTAPGHIIQVTSKFIGAGFPNILCPQPC